MMLRKRLRPVFKKRWIRSLIVWRTCEVIFRSDCHCLRLSCIDVAGSVVVDAAFFVALAAGVAEEVIYRGVRFSGDVTRRTLSPSEPVSFELNLKLLENGFEQQFSAGLLNVGMEGNEIDGICDIGFLSIMYPAIP